MSRTVDPALLDGKGRGRIEAAAGCGKTESIVHLTSIGCGRKTLILTHTLAGVSALRRRLHGAGVPANRYALSSIDAWCVRRVSEFPMRAGPMPDPSNARLFYPAVRKGCLRLLASCALDAALVSSYGRVFVDEYQDCGPDQHAIACTLAKLIPTFVFGDPLQAVFNFPGSPVVAWDRDVAPAFPLIETLDHPWRWERVGAVELGQWLGRARESLRNGAGIDLQQLPEGCEWRQLSGNAAKDTRAIRTATSYWHRADGSVLVLADPTQPQRHADIARAGDGIQVVENLDLRTVIQAVARLDQSAEPERLHVLLDLAHSVMTGISVNDILRRCDILQRGRSRTPATADEATALEFLLQPDWPHAEAALRRWAAQADRRVFRREVVRMLLDCFRSTATGRQPSLAEAMASARERRRHQGRSAAARSIGSTLLLKGLEADYTVLLDLEALDPPHIYVALTRATRGMLVFSRDRWLGRTQ